MHKSLQFKINEKRNRRINRIHLKRQKENWIEVITRKISNSEAKKLYNKLIQKDIDTGAKGKSNDMRKYNISDTVNNLNSIFTSTYLHQKDVSKETMFEKSIAARIKLRKERFDEIKRKEQTINNEVFKEYFTDYQSPSNMYKKLSETENVEIKKI